MVKIIRSLLDVSVPISFVFELKKAFKTNFRFIISKIMIVANCCFQLYAKVHG
ncbi:MAG: hypothetical protein LBT66_07240 [Methanobrevibacter sp.]|nr:hypothetical protein [Candidatus Methanovirga meridionalis]